VHRMSPPMSMVAHYCSRVSESGPFAVVKQSRWALSTAALLSIGNTGHLTTRRGTLRDSTIEVDVPSRAYRGDARDGGSVCCCASHMTPPGPVSDGKRVVFFVSTYCSLFGGSVTPMVNPESYCLDLIASRNEHVSKELASPTDRALSVDGTAFGRSASQPRSKWEVSPNDAAPGGFSVTIRTAIRHAEATLGG
jgi:hypothetical protein